MWFYNMEADGQSLDKKRADVEENDIPDILQRWQNLNGEEERTRYDKSFFVPVEEIRKKKYSLSFNNYMEILYTPPTYKSTAEYFADGDRLAKELQEGLQKFKEML